MEDPINNGFYNLQVPWNGNRPVMPSEVLDVEDYLHKPQRRNGARLQPADRNLRRLWRVTLNTLENMKDGNKEDMDMAYALLRSKEFDDALGDIRTVIRLGDSEGTFEEQFRAYSRSATVLRDQNVDAYGCVRELCALVNVFGEDARSRTQNRRTVYMLHALGMAFGLYTYFNAQPGQEQEPAQQRPQSQPQGLLNQIRIAGNATGRTGDPARMLKKVKEQFRPANVSEMLGYLPQALQHALNTRGNIVALDVPEDRKFTEIGLVLLGTLAIVLALMRQ
jgi:hypothetical protein